MDARSSRGRIRFLSGLLIGFALTVLLSLPKAKAEETDCLIHDPSTIIKRGNVYWVFGTGIGCPSFSSPDRLHWTFQGQVFANPPRWIDTAVPGNKGNFIWAPDVRSVGSKYYLYYSVSTFGSNVSAIGLATSTTLDPASWTDQGIVVRSTSHSNSNAIDACIAQDASGGLWLTFGSFWSGIQMIQIDARTGKQTSSNPTIYHLAAHPQDRADSIEASCIYYHNGYYYLFVNWDYCCRGEKSTYNIRVGRSHAITGPYLDKANQDLRRGGGTPFLSAISPVNATNPDEVGPGHAGILADTDGDWFSCHYDWARDHNGASVLNLLKLTWDADGWPAVP